MNRKFGLALLIGLFVILLGACERPGGGDDAASDDTAEVSETVDLDSDGDAQVENADGTTEVVPLVNTTEGTDVSADTTADSMTPQSIPAGLCPTLESWGSLVDCVEDNNLDWYIQAVDERAAKTGFDWATVVRWSTAKTATGTTPEARVIQVFGDSVTDEEARQRAAELVGEEMAGKLHIIRQQACFVNTRGFKAASVQDFVYCPPENRQVRVSLNPFLLDAQGAVVGLIPTTSGVFVDCQNIWWITKISVGGGCVTNCAPPPPVNPPPPEVCPPDMPHGTPPVCKDDATAGPAHNPQFPEQQKPNVLPAKPDHYQPVKPADPPPVYVAPPPPPPPPPAPRPTPVPTPEGGSGGSNDNSGDPGAP